MRPRIIKNFIPSALLALCFFFGFQAASAASSENRAYALKAAYIYYFARFTSWNKTDKKSEGKINLCAFTTNDNLNNEFQSVANKSSARRVSLKYDRISEDDSLEEYSSRCHIVYLDESHTPLSQSNLDALLNKGVLLVTEEKAKGVGGVIIYVMNENKLGFEINRTFVSDADLKISSKLLSLATRLTK